MAGVKKGLHRSQMMKIRMNADRLTDKLHTLWICDAGDPLKQQHVAPCGQDIPHKQFIPYAP